MAWEVLNHETIKADRFTIEKQVVKRDEHVTFNFSYIAIRHGVCILAVNEQQEIVCIKQYRHAFLDELWEFPAGAIDGEELPLEAAKRELLEEAGVEAEKWTDLGRFYPSPGSTSEVIYLFLAEQLTMSSQQLEETEQIECTMMPQPQFEQLLLDHTFLHGAGLAAYTKYKVLK